MNRIMTSACAALVMGTGAFGAPPVQDDLSKGFVNPPASARPHTWWHWINGNESIKGITADLEAMKRVGIGGAQIFNVDVGIPAGNAPFMSRQWRECILHAAKEAKRLGLQLCVHNCAGWSSSGGPWITPDHAMQMLVSSEKTVTGPSRLSENLAQPPMRHGYYRDIAVLAFKTPESEAGGSDRKLRIAQIDVKAAFSRGGQIQPDLSLTPSGMAIRRDTILDVTDKMGADGHMTWNVPDGEWTILRIGHTCTGAVNAPAPESGRGLECDKLSKEALDAHWAGMMATVIKELGPLAGKVLNNVLIDSYEVGSQNWTPKFREEFQRRRGYDLLPFLPVVTGRVVESVEVSERFLWDFRRTICDLFAENYAGHMAELCHSHGMKFSVEGYGNGPFDNLQYGGAGDIPMGEFWVGGGALETTKLASSSGHTYGRPVIGAESFTADEQRAKWLQDPYALKALGDLVFCNGVNRYIFHRYAHQPWTDLEPGMTMGPWGTNLERTVTWWNQGAAWMRYIARCQYLLQSGRFSADLCYFYGEDGPNDLPSRRGIRPVIPAGYDYDGCDARVVLERMQVRGGDIVLPDGMRYRVLVLPESRFMSPTMLAKIRDLVREGATVVGPKPVMSPSLTGYPACDAEVRRIAEEVWGDCDGESVKEHIFGQGRVVWGKPLDDVLAQKGVKPDFEYPGSAHDSSLVDIHRIAAGADIYFVSNQRYRPREADCTFRVRGKLPELWYPDTGVMKAAPIWEEKEGRTIVHLRLDPAGSVFVVFRRAASTADHLVSLEHVGSTSETLHAPHLEIQKARYEAGDGRGADVTAQITEMVVSGQYAIAASNDLFGDPVPNVVKRLRVEYLLNGKPMQKTVGENETLELVNASTEVIPQDYEIASGSAGLLELTLWQPGVYRFRTARGATKSIEASNAAESLKLAGPWSLRFPAHWGAPEQIKLDKLISWPEHSEPGVRYFSGTAEYTTEVDVPARMLGSVRRMVLDLGRVRNFAEVALNGRSLGVLWKPPFRVDVTGQVKPGRNVLSIKVTNLWPNRLIGDEQLPDEVEWQGNAIAKFPQWLLEGKPRPKTGRYTFSTWRVFRKDSPLLESGLIGPVVFRSARKETLRLYQGDPHVARH